MDNNSRIVSQHATLVAAMKGKARLLYDANRYNGDPELKRFPMRTGPEALESLSAINAHEHRWQYTRAEYMEITDAVSSAAVKIYGVLPEIRDCDADDPNNNEPETCEFDPDNFNPNPNDFDGVRAPFSAPVNTLVSNRARPTEGELEQRRPPLLGGPRWGDSNE